MGRLADWRWRCVAVWQRTWSWSNLLCHKPETTHDTKRIRYWILFLLLFLSFPFPDNLNFNSCPIFNWTRDVSEGPNLWLCAWPWWAWCAWPPPSRGHAPAASPSSSAPSSAPRHSRYSSPGQCSPDRRAARAAVRMFSSAASQVNSCRQNWKL